MRYIIAIFVVVVLVVSACAQGYITLSQTSHKASAIDAPPTRDFWFAIPQNYDPADKFGKVFSFYITSNVNTKVKIQVQGQAIVTKSVSANQVLTHVVDLNLEITRSSAIETEKAIHIWSDDADLNVYFMSRNDFTSDGTVVLPTYSYGKEYVVAAATALYATSSPDYPSEFIIIATADNTIVTITPSQDIRQEGMPSVVKYPKKEPFTLFLKKGECIQYQTTLPQDLPWDLSGTVITSTEPVAVIGASACPFIPSDPYCDHVIEMIPPTDLWGKKYYSMNFAGRKYGGDSFLLIASKAGQSIYRNNNLYATLGKFETYFRDDITGANSWTSDYPFLLVQYVNSAFYAVPSGQARNAGDPAMVVLYPDEKAQNTILLQTPTITGSSGQTSFTNCVNVLVPTAAISTTRMDGKLITDYFPITRTSIPNTTQEAFRLEKIGIGRHSIISDSAISAYAYGYAADDSYAWSVPGTLLPINSVDTVSPSASSIQECYCANITIRDKHPNSSKLLIATASVDSNMIVLIPDNVSGADSIVVKVCVVDSSKPAAASIESSDDVGNTLVITSSYTVPRYFKSNAEKISFGNVPVGTSAERSIELQNMGDTPDTMLIGFINGNKFSITNLGTSTFLPQEKQTIKIAFESNVEGSFYDTLLCESKCQVIRIPVVAGIENPEGRVPDSIYVGCIPVGDTLEGNVIFTNANTYPLTIIAINQYGDPDFVRDGTPSLPRTVAPNATAKIGILFNPLSATQKNALLTVVYETDDAIRDSVSTKLAGCGLDLGVEDKPEIHTLPSNSPDYTHAIERLRSTDELMFIQSLTPNPASGIVKCIYAIDEAADVSIELLDMLGKVVARPIAPTRQIRGVYEVSFDVSNLPSNAYFVRISGGGFTSSRRVIVSH